METLQRSEEYLAIQERMQRIKKLRTRMVSNEQRLDMIHVFYEVQKQGILQALAHPEVKKQKVAAQDTACRLLGYSNVTVWKACKAWKACKIAGNSATSGNHLAKSSRIPSSYLVVSSVRKFLLSQQAAGSRTTAAEVTEHLALQGFISRGSDGGTLRATQRFMSSAGFVYDGRKDIASYIEPMHIQARRMEYTDEILSNRAIDDRKRLREVYVDEISIGDVDVLVAMSGPRVRPSNPSSDTDSKSGAASRKRSAPENGDEAGIVARWLHSQDPRGTSRARRAKSDAESFCGWFEEQLLPSLTDPSLIIVSAGLRHKAIIKGVKRPSNMNRSELVAYLRSHKLPFDESSPVAELRRLSMNWEQVGTHSRLAEMALHRGHKLVFTPPDHRELHPTELLWEHLREHIGSISGTPSLQESRDRLSSGLDFLETRPGLIQSLIDDVDRSINEYAYLDAATSLMATSGSHSSSSIAIGGQNFAFALESDDNEYYHDCSDSSMGSLRSESEDYSDDESLHGDDS